MVNPVTSNVGSSGYAASTADLYNMSGATLRSDGKIVTTANQTKNKGDNTGKGSSSGTTTGNGTGAGTATGTVKTSQNTDVKTTGNSSATVTSNGSTTTNGTTTNASPIEVDVGTGNQRTTTQAVNVGATGAANASTNASTNASAKKMLTDVDALLASKSGSGFKTPTNQAERTKAVAAVASKLSGAEKKEFLSQLKTLGKDFNLNFGQPTIVTSGPLDESHQAIHDALAIEQQTGKAWTPTVKAETPAATKTEAPAATKEEDDSPGVASRLQSLPQEVQDFVATIKGQSRAATREMVASWDLSGNDKVGPSEITGKNSATVASWEGFGKGSKRTETISVDAMTDRLRKAAEATQ
jgi:hypothetical protein